MKICISCNIEKPFTEFHKCSSNEDGFHKYCKYCRKESYQKNIKYYIEYRKNYYKTGYYKEYHKKNRESILEKSKEKYKKNKESHRKAVYKWRNENRDKYNEYRRKYCKNKSELDPMFKFRKTLGCRTVKAFNRKYWAKNSKTEQMLGADYKTVMNHIESRFKKGMTWDNRNEWHIDHIIPLASAKTEKELIQLCHYTNLQPLWADENIKKGNKIIACRINL